MMPHAGGTSTTSYADTTAAVVATSSAINTPATRLPLTRMPTSTPAPHHHGPAITASSSIRTGIAATAAEHPARHPQTCTMAHPPRPLRPSLVLLRDSPSTPTSQPACHATGTGAPSERTTIRHVAISSRPLSTLNEVTNLLRRLRFRL